MIMYNHVTYGNRLSSLSLPLQNKGNSIKDYTNVCPKMDRLNLSILLVKLWVILKKTVYNNLGIALQLTLELNTFQTPLTIILQKYPKLYVPTML